MPPFFFTDISALMPMTKKFHCRWEWALASNSAALWRLVADADHILRAALRPRRWAMW
jgi:hypothetical protein